MMVLAPLSTLAQVTQVKLLLLVLGLLISQESWVNQSVEKVLLVV